MTPNVYGNPWYMTDTLTSVIKVLDQAQVALGLSQGHQSSQISDPSSWWEAQGH